MQPTIGTAGRGMKGSMTNGVRPTFKFWMDQADDTLSEHDGGYVLADINASRISDEQKFRVVASRTVRARDGSGNDTNWTNRRAYQRRSSQKPQ